VAVGMLAMVCTAGAAPAALRNVAAFPSYLPPHKVKKRRFRAASLSVIYPNWPSSARTLSSYARGFPRLM
jgi:hypothetical protein